MKRASDGQLLAVVLAVPVGALLLVSALGALLGEANTGKTIAIGCAMILSLSSLLPQMAGVRFATYGPRSLQNRIGVLGGLFATLAIMHMPEAEVTFGWAVLPLLILLLTAAFLGFSDISKDLSIPSHIKALRRHPRALRKVWRDMMFGVVLGLLLGASQAFAKDASPAQALWAGLVNCCAILTGAAQVPFARAMQMPIRRLAILTLAYGIWMSALIFIFTFVVNLSQKEGDEIAPLMIGVVFGSFIGMGITLLVGRNKAKRA